MEWSTACPDWERRIVAREPLITFPPLFPDEAQLALDIFLGLRVKDVQGSPPMRELCQPWLEQFVAAIFGAYDAETGRRLIQEFFLLISKKNSKSTGAAGIMQTALVRNWREAAEFIVLAPTIEIANNSYLPARDMVRKDEELSKLFHVQDHFRTITHRENGSTLKVVAADSETVSGKKATGILIEELWLFGKNARAENMLLEATGGLASRPEGFVIFLTTQSDEPPAGVFAQKLAYARDVRDGKVIDPKFLPVLYEFPEHLVKAKKHLDREYFYITNPNLGASVDADFIERELAKAKIAGEGSVRKVLAKHLNVQIGASLMGEPWAAALYWEAAGDPTLTLEVLLERSEVCVIGIDGGGLDDLLGLGVLGRCRETKRWLHWGHAWAHPIVFKRRPSEVTALRDMERAGHLTVVEAPGPDVRDVADIACRIRDLGLLPEKAAIGVDPVGIGEIVEELARRGFSAEETKGEILGISQGWKLNAAIETAGRKIAGGEFVHGAQALMAYAVGNAKVEPRGNAVTITKQVSGRAKIDPLMALFNCVALMALNPEAAGGSFWEGAAAKAEAERAAIASTPPPVEEMVDDQPVPLAVRLGAA